MDQHSSQPANPSSDPRSAPAGAGRESQRKDPFIQLMFFQGSRGSDEPPHVVREIPRRTGTYEPIRHSTAAAGERYVLPAPGLASVRIDSPAVDVMTDLRRVAAATIAPEASVTETHHAMITRGVRSLFVVDDAPTLLGVVTSTDISGERPIQLAYSRRIRYSDVPVRDIMTPADRLEMLDLADVAAARVGDVIATLKLAGRQHALVVLPTEATARAARTVCGIFSLTQIARQLGIPPENTHDIARTFAEIEAVIAG